MSYINLPVKEEFIPAVIEFIAKLQKEEKLTYKLIYWNQDLINKLWKDSDEAIRLFFRTLATTPNNWFSSTELVAGGSRRVFGGMLGALGHRLSTQYNGEYPFERRWDKETREYSYMMRKEIADMFSSLL